MGDDRSAQGLLRKGGPRLALLALASTLALLLASSSAMAALPSHPRTPSLDIVGLNHACGVAVDSKGDLYASSAGAGKVLIFSPADHETPIGEVADANEPCALAVTSTGNLYVSEAKTGEVVRYKPAIYPFVGAPSYGPREVIDASGQAKGIAVDPFDDRLYVAEGAHVSAYDSKGNLGVNEVQEVNCLGCTAGTYALIFKGEETKPIAFEGEALPVKEALEELAAIGPGDVSVKNGSNARSHLITFEGKYAHADVEALQCKDLSLEGAGHECKVSEQTKSWSGHIGEGDLTEATGVTAYAYKGNASQVTYNLAVADAASDEVKLFSADNFKEQKLRHTLDGPKEGEDFGFGAQGAYLASDSGTCPPAAEKACTAGHFFVYDNAHQVIDELEASGPLVSQAAFAAGDGAPTAFALDRSGGANNGTLYATTGAAANARVLAFGALGAPSRSGPLKEKEQSLTLAKACSIAIDDFGNRYVSVGTEVKVYPPTGGKELTKFSTGTKSCRTAIDKEGNLYALLSEKVVYFKPESYPPKEGTKYGAAVEVVKQSEFSGEAIKALAVNPANGHLFVINNKQVNEYDSVANGSKVLKTNFGASIGIPTMFAIAVYGATGDVYITNSGGKGSVYVIDPTGKEVITRIIGVGSPKGSLNTNGGAVAVDQSNGHAIVFETEHQNIQEYEASGTFVASFGSFTELVTTNYGLAVDNGASSPNKGDVFLAYDDTAKETPDLWAFGGLGYPPAEEHELTIKKTGDGSGAVTSAPTGIDCGKACSEKYAKGTGVVLSATPDPENAFEGWSGCEAEFEPEPGEALCEVTMQDATEASAKFKSEKEKFPLKVVIEGSGSGVVTSAPEGIECEPECEAEFGKGSTVTLTADRDPGSEVEAWEGCDAEPSPSECEVQMSEAKEVKVKLGPEHPLLRVEVGGSGAGEVLSLPAGPIECPPDCEATLNLGDVLLLEAQTDPGSQLVGWEGCDAEPSPGECEVQMNEPKTVKATFAELPQAIVKPPNPLAFTEATLRGEVGTAGLVTEYHFRYLSEAAAEQNEKEAKPPLEGAKSTPTAKLKPAAGLLAVKANVSSLAEGTAYRFGLVVENAAGKAEDEGQFTTLKEQPPLKCPNEALRTGASANLPDCRAYELVSPPEDGGYTVGWSPGGTENSSFPTALATGGGESVIFETYGGPLPEVGGNGVQNGYRAQRGASGWSTASYGPTYAQTSSSRPGGVSVDQGYSFWAAAGKSGTLDPKSVNNARYLALPISGANPACSPEPAGRFELIGCGPEGTDPEAIGRWISPGADHVIFTSDEQLAPGAPAKGTTAIYDRSAGATAQVISLLPGDMTPGGSAAYEGVSADGSAVAFGIGGTLYVRIGDSETLEVDSGATFAGLANDGSALFYLKAGVLYRFDTEAGTSIQISAGGAFVNVPAEGTRAYFTSSEALAPGAEAGKDNLYLWEAEGDVTRFVAVLAHGDVTGTQSPIKNSHVNLAQWVTGLDPNANGNLTGPALDPSRSTPDGRVIVFQSIAPLTGYDSQGHTEVFRYDAADESLVCISCGPEGTTANSGAQLQDEAPGFSPLGSALTLTANLSTDGGTAFFTSAEPLVPADHNGVADVYEWREGLLSLISTGQSAYPSYLYAVSASGEDVFFATREALVAGDDEDGGSQSIYDARVNGGFAAPGGGGACEGESCRGAPSTEPNLRPPLSTTSPPAEPPPNQPHPCPKGKHKVKRAGKIHCTKKHKPHKHSKHHDKRRKGASAR